MSAFVLLNVSSRSLKVEILYEVTVVAFIRNISKKYGVSRGFSAIDELRVLFIFLLSRCTKQLLFGCQYRRNRLPSKTRPRMIYYVSSGTLNPTHSLTHSAVV